MVENVVSGIHDEFRKHLADFKFWITAGVCLVSFLVGDSPAHHVQYSLSTRIVQGFV